MRPRAVLVLTMLLAGALAFAGCASTSASSGGNTFPVSIEVDNNLAGLSGVTVYVARSNGTGRRLLGPVDPSRRQTFQYDAQEGSFILRARQSTGADIVSDAFHLTPGMRVQWSIAQNRLVVGTP